MRSLCIAVREFDRAFYSHTSSEWRLLQNRLGRTYSSQPIRSAGNVVRANVPSGLNPPRDIHIAYPPRPESSGPLILALGDGVQKHAGEEQAVIQAIAMSSNAIVVQPNYQITRDWTFPAAVHMTLAVFDWMWRNLQQTDSTADQNAFRRVGVCGDWLGGSLATSLALTEASQVGPHVAAAAVTDPVLDWTDIFPPDRPMTTDDLNCIDPDNNKTQATEEADIDARTSVGHLLMKRREIFRKAESFFDPFVSPLLFFRTPCFDLPPTTASFLVNPSEANSTGDENTEVIGRKRIYSRRYPPQNSGLVLPSMKITTGRDFALKDQAKEFIQCMQKSAARTSGSSRLAQQASTQSDFVAEETDHPGGWNERLAYELGDWLGTELRKR